MYYCFICGKGCGGGGGGGGGGVEKGSWSDLKTLLGLLCKLMSVPGWKNLINGEEVEEEEEERTCWNSQTCGDCYQVLIQMEQLNALLERTRSSLERHAKQVESLVVKSGAENVFCLSWTAPFRAFREQVIEAALRTTRLQPEQVPMMMPPLPPPSPNVKVEITTAAAAMEQWGEEEDDYSPEHDEPGNTGGWESDPLSFSPPPPPEATSLLGPGPSITAPQQPNPENFVKTEPILLPELNQAKGIGDSRRRSPRNHNQSLTPCFVRLEKFDPSLLTSPRRRAGRLKRSHSGGLDSRSSKQMKPTREDDDTDGESNDDSPPNGSDYAPSSSSSDNEGDHDSGSEYDDEGEQQNPARRSKQNKSHLAKGKPVQNNNSSRSPPFIPFIIADASKELYLFRQATFVTKTNSHLVCHAFQCNFRVELSYYTAFQEMRSHIHQFHNTYNNGNRTKRHCLLCNTTFRNLHTFRTHLPHQHPHLHDDNSTGICESCLKPLPPRPGGQSLQSWRAHMATHKSQEEMEGEAALRLHSWKVASKKSQKPKGRKDHNDGDSAKPKKHKCTWEGCTYASNHSRNLRRHMETHLPPEERTYRVTCDQCGVTVNKDSLKQHVLRLHNPELADTILMCPYCDRRFFTSERSHYQSHLLAHQEGVKKPFSCDQCGAAYTSSSGLFSHVKIKHGPQPEAPIKCDHCEKTYIKIKSLDAHVRKHHSDLVPLKRKRNKVSKLNALEDDNGGSSVQRWPCSLCELVCPTMGALQGHLEEAHGIAPTIRKPPEEEDAKKHKCTWEACTYASNIAKNLRRHMQTHLPPEERTDRTTCDQCGVSLHKDGLKQHVLTVHNPELAETILQCGFCDKKYFTWQNSYYQAHLLTHQGIMPFVCSECGAGFITSGNLGIHMGCVHAPRLETPKKCDHCDRTYTKIRSLECHVRKHHSDVVPLKWKGKKVSKLNRLGTSAEEDEEGGEKKPVYGPIQRWPCSRCDVICSHKCALQRHMNTKHGDGDGQGGVQKESRLSRSIMEDDHSGRDYGGGNEPFGRGGFFGLGLFQ